MSIEIRRFGVGHRRPDGPAGSVGVTAQLIHSDERGAVTELAFGRAARIEPHASIGESWFVVIEGGGWIGVGDERTRIAAGEAARWPAALPHAAWTEHSQMRAFLIEFSGDDAGGPALLDGTARALGPGDRDARGATRGEGRLAEDAAGSRPTDPSAGEPA